MAQFDVHRNPGKNRDGVPFVVVVQSSVFDGYQRRVVAPLVRKSQLSKTDNPRFNPTFTVDGIAVVLHTLELVSVPVERLGKPVASLVKHGDRIVDALDRLFTRAYG